MKRSRCECGCGQLAAGVVTDLRRRRVGDTRQVCELLLNQAAQAPHFRVLHRYPDPRVTQDPGTDAHPVDYRPRMSASRRALRMRWQGTGR